MKRSYALITPCRDEARYLPTTIAAVAAQSLPPTRWILVDDGSTDETPAILARAAREHAFIQVLRREDRGGRSVGPGVIDAFYAGLEQLDLDEVEYVCKFDADLNLGPRYFERAIEIFEEDPWLGTFSGKIFLRLADRLVEERIGDENSVGAAKLYRTRCFREIGGFVHGVCWDGIDGHMCRMRGWVAASRDEPPLRIEHLRQIGSSHRGVWTGRLRWGAGKWFMGSSLPYMLAVAAYRMFERPYLVGGAGILFGYLRAMLRREPRFDDLEFRQFLRRYERAALVRGKDAAARVFNDRVRTRFAQPALRAGS